MIFGLQQGAKISAQRRQSIWPQNLPDIPKQLQQSYVQAHKLGFETLMNTTENTLKITYNDQVRTLTSDQDLTQYI